MTSDSSAQPPGDTPADTRADTPTGDDQMRERFRAALDRKHAQQAAAGGGSGDQPGGAHPHTGPAKTQRTFRRKSG